MKKLILFVLLLALVVSPALAAKDKSIEDLPLGSRGNGILCTDFRPAPPKKALSAAEQAAYAQELLYPPYPYEDTFLLHSYPSSQYKIYIDVDGAAGGYRPWDADGDGASFSDNERLMIQKMWYLVSEDFMPFTIDVTTEEPPRGWLGMRAVVDGSDKYGGGWAYMNTWPNTTNTNIAYNSSWGDDWVYIAQCVSHEVGHTLNLGHSGDDTWGYYMGHGEGWTEWGAIMGYDSWNIGVWDDGNYPNSDQNGNIQDTLNMIETRQGVDYRPDDHGNNIAAATAIDITAADFIAEGLIEQNSDVDYFSFTMASAGDVTIAINGDLIINISQSNLDVLAKIYDSGGAVLYTSNPEDRLHAAFSVTLAAGDYYLSVDGVGFDDPRGDPSDGFGYSDYGVLGYYNIKQYIGDTNPPTPDAITFASAPAATGATSIAMTATTASDPDGVVYKFICVSGGGNDSVWQDSAYYEDFPLTPNTQYTYRVIARDESVGVNQTAASADMSATTDAGDSVTNILLPANGGVLESYTSEYNAIYGPAQLTDKVTYETGWTSVANPTSPQEFVYSFDSAQDATLDRALIHGGNGEGSYYCKDVEVWTSANGVDFTLAGSGTLANQSFDTVVIDLGGVTAKKVKLAITSGYRTNYWELAEFKVYGTLPLDTTPPTPNPASFASLPSADGDTSISMTANIGSDPSGPVLYLFDEVSGNPGADDSGWQTSPSYTDTGLTPGTEYTYTVAMMDQEGNFGSASAYTSATTTSGSCIPTEMHIADIACSEDGTNCYGPDKQPFTTVTIYDNCGNPVQNALVDVYFSAPYDSYGAGTTNASGAVTVSLPQCQRKPTWTGTVTNVTHGSLTYNPDDNVADNCGS